MKTLRLVCVWIARFGWKSMFAFEKVGPIATISWNDFAETICYRIFTLSSPTILSCVKVESESYFKIICNNVFSFQFLVK